MGWDGFADNTKGHIKKFEAAAKAVAKKCGSVDGFLAKGGLDCSACASALEAATGANAWDEGRRTRREGKTTCFPCELAPIERSRT